LQLASDGLGQSGVSNPSGEGFTYGDHQLDAIQAPLFEVGNELRPEGLVLAVAHLDAEQLPMAVGIDAHGDDDSPGADLQGLAQPALEVGGIELDVGIGAAVQRAAQEGLHLLVDVLTDAGSPEIPGD
jgi:hypothetical protein